jgi:hypothetical protein
MQEERDVGTGDGALDGSHGRLFLSGRMRHKSGRTAPFSLSWAGAIGTILSHICELRHDRRRFLNENRRIYDAQLLDGNALNGIRRAAPAGLVGTDRPGGCESLSEWARSDASTFKRLLRHALVILRTPQDRHERA